MRKKLTLLAIYALAAAGFAAAQTLEISGEMKTGFYWERLQVEGQDAVVETRMHHNDDAGPNEGRFRLNMHLVKENIGMKVRFQQTAWTATQPNQWDFAFAYGNFIEDQLKVTIGKLGESPWSAGGPDIWQELDNQIGIRTEVMPQIVPGLNIGFVLNGYNNAVYWPEKRTLGDMLSETVLGVAYTNDYFHGRFSYRLDGEADVYNMDSEGMELMYRLEERVLRNYIEGFSVWANGWWRGIGTDDRSIILYRNWLYAEYSPPAFTAQLRLGYDIGYRRQQFNSRIGFYYNILPFLSVGSAFKYNQDFGDERDIKDVPYILLGIEPQIKVTFGPNAYIALVYFYDSEYVKEATIVDPLVRQKHRLNLRTVYTF
ncbi:MAG: hypothetical protein FWH38_04985 [Treponema sp.]|nr:hypothetical protein [Treponema sp.]